MLLHFLYSAVLVFVTVLVHALATTGVLAWLYSPTGLSTVRGGHVSRILAIGGVVFVLSIVSVLESGVWAAFYLAVGAISDVNEALYFSLVTFTTLGYGDVTLSEEWRLVGAFQAANGIIIFGWTTALIVALLQHLSANLESQSKSS
jgi:hypothetical protein